jgi:hypothetical protein
MSNPQGRPDNQPNVPSSELQGLARQIQMETGPRVADPIDPWIDVEIEDMLQSIKRGVNYGELALRLAALEQATIRERMRLLTARRELIAQ